MKLGYFKCACICPQRLDVRKSTALSGYSYSHILIFLKISEKAFVSIIVLVLVCTENSTTRARKPRLLMAIFVLLLEQNLKFTVDIKSTCHMFYYQKHTLAIFIQINNLNNEAGCYPFCAFLASQFT